MPSATSNNDDEKLRQDMLICLQQAITNSLTILLDNFGDRLAAMQQSMHVIENADDPSVPIR